MAYRNLFGRTVIIPGKVGNLHISWDCDDNPFEESHKVEKRKPTFLFTPNMNDTSLHYHIELSRKQAEKLNKWLTEYLKDTKHARRKAATKKK